MLATFSDAISRTTPAIESSSIAGTSSLSSLLGLVDTPRRESGRTMKV
jgi:hypothetical protein